MRVRHTVLFIAALLITSCGRPPAPQSAAPPPPPAPDAGKQIRELVDHYFDQSLELDPVGASYTGDHRYDDQLPNYLGAEYLERIRTLEQHYLDEVKKLDVKRLGDEDALTYAIFVHDRSFALEGLGYPGKLLPVSQYNSATNEFAQLGSGTTAQPFKTVQDYDNFLKRIDGFVVWIDQAIVNMREGMTKGIVQPRVLMEKALPQLQSQIVTDPGKSIFYRPIAGLPKEFSAADRERLTAAYRGAIQQKIVPAYRHMHDFIRDEYLPKSRATVGLSALPGGADWYQYLIRAHTTTSKSPEEIHQLGLAEIDRIGAGIQAAMQKAGFKGDVAALTRFMRQDARFYYRKPDQLLGAYRGMQQRVNEAVPRLFSAMPKAPLEIRPMEAFLAPGNADAEYIWAAADGSRPGIFYVNTYDLRSRPNYDIESVYLHEAVPGHHFQLSLAMENLALPKFRRISVGDTFSLITDSVTAYVEGWALYCESLGDELGFYTDPYQKLGALMNESWRAARLVVDTGMHAKAWSREQALDYLRRHTAAGESDLSAEIERYIADPGQALAYKIGELTIRRLRSRAESELGPKFDVRQFHAEILKEGALPLDILEQRIDRWIERSRPAKE